MRRIAEPGRVGDLGQGIATQPQVGGGEILQPQAVAAQGQTDRTREAMRGARVRQPQLPRALRERARRVLPEDLVQAVDAAVARSRPWQLPDGRTDNRVE